MSEEAGAVAQTGRSGMEAGAATPLIPRLLLFGNPERTDGQIRPDGAYTSFRAPVEGVMNIWIAPADNLAAARPVTFDTGRGIPFHFWAYDNRSLLYGQDTGGDENFHLFRLDPETGETLDLTPFPGVQARPVKLSSRHPESLLVAVNDRDPRFHNLYRIDLRTGERTCLFQNDRYIALHADDDFRVRLGEIFASDFTRQIYRIRPDGDPELLATFGTEDVMASQLLQIDARGESLVLIDSRGRDRSALARLNLQGGEIETLFESDLADVGDVIFDPDTHLPLAVAVNFTRKQWTALDPAVEADMVALQAVCDGDFTVVAQSRDNRTWIVTYTRDNSSADTYRYDRAGRQATLLFHARPALNRETLARMHPAVLTSRDGLKLVCYLTLPPGSNPDGGPRPERPLPLVLQVHGGPWSRDLWGFQPFSQWLANRGYAVLSVNFRGSTGFGKAFVNAANREWGGKMHEDLLDAVDWAVAEKIADPQRIGIFGGSYGGYATLVGLTATPTRFACGVDIVGPSNLLTFMASVPPYWLPIMPLLHDRVGNPDTEEGREFLRSRSPLTHVERICRPLLIAQGANDPRVVKAESDQIVHAMQEKGIPVTYLLYPDEGHGFQRPENNLSFAAVMEAFLSRYLGGACEPIGTAMAGSSVEVIAGGEGTPGPPERPE